ncbi:MAG: hypothetical protein NW217_03230 [Hyphomicrobiaceae bacterium]|nr:hypothetical protein [Hyphomicrobiaceae bacterium]
MPYFILQTALLLLAAYLTGAILGCVVRRLLTAPRDVEAVQPTAATATRPAVATPAVAGEPAAQRASPEPVQPRIESVTPLTPPVNEARQAARFERALTSGPGQAAPAVAPPATIEAGPAPSAAAGEPMPRVIMPAASSTGGVATTSAPIAAPVPPPATPMPPTAVLPVDDLTRIRNIDAETAATLARLGVARYEDLARLAAADVARINAAIPGGRVSRESWIEQARILATGGSTAYAKGFAATDSARAEMWGSGAGTEVAARAPVTDPAGAAGAKQSTIVASPVQASVTAAAVAAAAAATAATLQMQKSAAAQMAKPVAAPADVPQLSVPAPVASAPTKPVVPVAATPPDDLTLLRAIDEATQRTLRADGITRFAQIAAFTAADVERCEGLIGVQGRVSREGWIEQAQILAKGGETEYARRRRAGGQVVPMPDAQLPAAASTIAAATPPASPPAPPAAPEIRADPAAATADDLTRIVGIDGAARDILNANGISRFDDIAGWGANEVRRFDGLIGAAGRISRENWIEQARALGKGEVTGDAEPTATAPPATAPMSAVSDAAGDGEPAAVATTTSMAPTPMASAAASSADPATRPTRLAEAIRANQDRARPATETARSDVGSLRSVRSELLRRQAGDSGPADDLKRIRGIGVLIEKKLNSLGITRYEQVANWTGADIDRMSQMLDFKGRIERESWVEQARILASGGQTDFSRRTDKS